MLKMNKTWQIVWALSLLVVVAHGKYSNKGQRICLVGAGVTGILFSNKLSSSPKEFEIIVFEKNSDVGGQWLYTDRTDHDEHGLPVISSIYKHMRTNGAQQLQVFPDYREFHEETRSYVRHQSVLQYLKNYVEHFGLRQFMRFDTWVETVKSIPNDKWHLELRDVNTNEKYDMKCDAVVVGTGHFHKPNISNIKGLETFPEPSRVMHSSKYRVPEIFADKTVVVLGASFSGLDIGIEISDYAKQVYISHRHEKKKIELPPNMIQIPEVVEVDGNEFILSNGSRVQADAIVLATGYLYDFPILDESAGISVVNGRSVRPLYKHLINAVHPTMAISGVPQPGFPFLIPYAQAEYFVAVLEGKVTLPSREEMLKDSELPEGVSVDKAHHMVAEAFAYYDELALAAGSKALPNWLKEVAWISAFGATMNPMLFRYSDIVVYENGTVDTVWKLYD